MFAIAKRKSMTVKRTLDNNSWITHRAHTTIRHSLGDCLQCAPFGRDRGHNAWKITKVGLYYVVPAYKMQLRAPCSHQRSPPF
jgi:hypothetical protein